jgi:hypothetical protein
MAETRTMEFASPDGVEVTVTVRSPDGKRMRSAAIESAMVNHCSLYPIAVDGKPIPAGGRGMSYWHCLALGFLVPLAAYALLAFVVTREGSPPVPDDLKVFLIGYVFPFFVLFATAIFALMVRKSRSYRATVESLGARRGATTPATA